MSADNYNVIRKHPDGGYFITTEFASEEVWRTTKERIKEYEDYGVQFGALDDDSKYPEIARYSTLQKAYQAADQMYSEYGTTTYGIEVIHTEKED